MRKNSYVFAFSLLFVLIISGNFVNASQCNPVEAGCSSCASLGLPPGCCGNGGSCFLAGTEIAMADGRSIPIEHIRVGDMVLGYDPETGEYVESKVLELESPIRQDYYIVEFEDGSRLEVTDEHPIFIKNSLYTGWASIRPESTYADASM
ncbi:MAG: hypothetical protein HGA85_01525, partial [Nanoarchaeota archaeon]|nr:hypothetical protein [Nanoarchaeota archaeon]